jgi:hypothetical protein
MPGNDQTYTLGESVTTAFVCGDPDGSGIASCTDNNGGSGSSGSLNTGSVGDGQTYTVTALSKDGQSTETSISYNVVPPTNVMPPAAPTVANLAPPVLGNSSNVTPVSGTILVELPGTNTFTSLPAGASLPIGSTVNADQGTVSVTTQLPDGTTQTGQFYDGEFLLTQSSSGTVIPIITGGNFAECPRAPHSKTKHAAARAAASKKKSGTVVRQLWGNAHGNYTTKGRYGSASVSGTIWLVQDRCDGTYILATKDNVIVTAYAHPHKHYNIKQGHHILIPAPGY